MSSDPWQAFADRLLAAFAKAKEPECLGCPALQDDNLETWGVADCRALGRTLTEQGWINKAPSDCPRRL